MTLEKLRDDVSSEVYKRLLRTAMDKGKVLQTLGGGGEGAVQKNKRGRVKTNSKIQTRANDPLPSEKCDKNCAVR